MFAPVHPSTSLKTCELSLSMTDKYLAKQLHFYETAPNEAAKDDALYRIGNHLELEITPCNGNSNLTDEQREAVLEAIKEVKTDAI